VISLGVLKLARARTKPDLVSAMTFLILPFASLVVTGWFYFVGATLLEGSGFLAAYTFVSRPRAPLYVEVGYAVRLVSRNPASYFHLCVSPPPLPRILGVASASVVDASLYIRRVAWCRAVSSFPSFSRAL
jgi:hypothetical protein